MNIHLPQGYKVLTHPQIENSWPSSGVATKHLLRMDLQSYEDEGPTKHKARDPADGQRHPKLR